MNDRGFSLIETLVAVSLVAVALTALLQMFAISIRANAAARQTTVATLLAGQKIEELQGARSGLAPSPSDSLQRNVDGRCDFLDEYGRSLGGGTVPPVGTVYVRRWSIESLRPGLGEGALLQVVVRPWRGGMSPPGVADSGPVDWRLLGGTHLLAVKTREVG